MTDTVSDAVGDAWYWTASRKSAWNNTGSRWCCFGVPDSEIDILSDALPNALTHALPNALLYPVPDALPVSVTVPSITEPHQDKFSDWEVVGCSDDAAVFVVVVGLLVGNAASDAVGLAVGDAVGLAVGDAVGLAVGEAVWEAVREAAGVAVQLLFVSYLSI